MTAYARCFVAECSERDVLLAVMNGFRPPAAVDKDLHPWSGAVPANPPSVESMTGWCPAVDENGKLSGQNGQSCVSRPEPPLALAGSSRR